MTNTTKYVELIGPGGRCKVVSGQEGRYLSQDGWKLAKKKVDGKPQAELAPETKTETPPDQDGGEGEGDGTGPDGGEGGDGGEGDLTRADVEQMSNKELAEAVEDFGLGIELSGNAKAKRDQVAKALGLE